ncbi:MAG: hypothetical protein ABR986_03470 [Methanomassiliicoccales archaeon]|jgi:hypothetical protein
MGKKLRLFVIIAGGCWMLGEGARMVVMSLFFQGWHYSPNIFDMFFDWVPLTILGSIFFYEGIKSFYDSKVEEQDRSKEIALVAVNKEHRHRFRATKFPK